VICTTNITARHLHIGIVDEISKFVEQVKERAAG
jgi:hypothetical protein